MMILKEQDLIAGEKGSYQIQAKIGSESAFGAVFKALDQDGEPVVIKQMLGESHIAGEIGMDYDYARKTFERESQILVNHNHEQIVKGIEFFEQDDELFLVMEFINGEDLDQVLIRKMDEDPGLPFGEEEAIAIAYELCRVIHAIHQLPGQILYRDLKPRNIMWDAHKKKIKIIDFGTARFMEAGQHSTQALGTPGYAPPEFYSTSTALSFASDVYTIGATLFELVTGEMPEPLFTPTNFHGQDGQLSPGFKQIITRAMEQDPKKRFHTAEEMGIALSKLDQFSDQINIDTKVKNPYPYLSCLCAQCGSQPKNNQSVFCSECGGKIHVMTLRVMPEEGLPMDLFLDKGVNLIGRTDMDEQIYPDVDLARYDPDCYISRKHCILRRQDTRFYIEALASTNKTVVNGFELPPNRKSEISNGTRLEIANLAIKFIVKPCLD